MKPQELEGLSFKTQERTKLKHHLPTEQELGFIKWTETLKMNSRQSVSLGPDKSRGRTIRINGNNMNMSARAGSLLLSGAQVCKVPPSIKCSLCQGTRRNLCPLSRQRLPNQHSRKVPLSTPLLWVLAGSQRGKWTYPEHRQVPLGQQGKNCYFPLELKMNTSFIAVWFKCKNNLFPPCIVGMH